jgi:predicted GNAT family acetyltransferase
MACNQNPPRMREDRQFLKINQRNKSSENQIASVVGYTTTRRGVIVIAPFTFSQFRRRGFARKLLALRLSWNARLQDRPFVMFDRILHKLL